MHMQWNATVCIGYLVSLKASEAQRFCHHIVFLVSNISPWLSCQEDCVEEMNSTSSSKQR